MHTAKCTCSLCCYKLNMLTAVYIRIGNVADCTVMFKCAHIKMLMSTAVGRVPLLTAVTMTTTVRVSTFRLVPRLRMSGLLPPLPLHTVTNYPICVTQNQTSCNSIKHTISGNADPGGRTVWGVGLGRLDCWDWGCGCVCCGVKGCELGWSFSQRSPKGCGVSDCDQVQQ